MAATQTAAQRALNIPELLEQILLDVPAKDVLLSQRVNSTFQAVVSDSAELQQLLWFKDPLHEGHQTNLLPQTILRGDKRINMSIAKPLPRRILIDVHIDSAAEALDGASFGKMLLWSCCKGDDYIDVRLWDVTGYKDLCGTCRDLNIVEVPTVMELVKLTETHPKAGEIRWSR